MQTKNPSNFDEQLNKIIKRNCIIGDAEYAKQVLKRINYYRLTAYFLPFKTKDDKYIEGTTFNNVFRIYEFDRKLRTLLFSVIEEIELMLRTQLSYYHAHKYGALGYLDKNNFLSIHNHNRFMGHITKAIDNNKKQAFVKHHIEHYDGEFPIWVIIELFTMGDLSLFYSDMHVLDKKAIAYNLFGTTHTNLSKWLRCLTDLRNYCAHYSRLYYNLFPAIPPTPKGFPYILSKRVFDYILVLKFLYPLPEQWNNTLIIPLQSLIEEYNENIHLGHIGFPNNWVNILKEPNPKRTKPNK